MDADIAYLEYVENTLDYDTRLAWLAFEIEYTDITEEG